MSESTFLDNMITFTDWIRLKKTGSSHFYFEHLEEKSVL